MSVNSTGVRFLSILVKFNQKIQRPSYTYEIKETHEEANLLRKLII
jgi:hypothetical protein